MSPDELRTCALAKYFPRISRAFTAMHVDVVEGKLQQGAGQTQAALAQALPRGHGEEFFYMAACLTSAAPRTFRTRHGTPGAALPAERSCS